MYVEDVGVWFSLDNRLLYCIREAGCQELVVKPAGTFHNEAMLRGWMSNFDTRTEGVTVEVRDYRRRDLERPRRWPPPPRRNLVPLLVAQVLLSAQGP